MQAPVTLRRNYFLSKAFHLNFMLRFILLIGASCVITGVMMYYYIQTLASGLNPASGSTMETLLPAIIITQLGVGLLLIVVAVGVVILLSQRIAGPLYRLERVAEHVGDGDLTLRVGFHRGDAFLPLKSSFQIMIDKLQHKMQKFEENLLEMKRVERELQEKVKSLPFSESEREQWARTMHVCVSKYEENLKSFKIPAR